MDELIKYLSNTSVNAPFFLVAGDDNYASIKTSLFEKGLKPVKVSDCCGTADKRPNLDNLIETFDFADIDIQSGDKKIVVFGLGEYLALCGNDTAFARLSKIKDTKIGNARVVLLLRGVSEIVRKLQEADPTRFDSRRILFTENTSSNIKITCVSSKLALPAEIGIKSLISKLEDGSVNLNVKSNIVFANSLVAINNINSAYDGVRYFCPSFLLTESLGTEEQWTEFLSDLVKANGEMKVIIDKIADVSENSFAEWIKGNAYKNWLYFILLKLKAADANNSYLKYVLDTTTSFAEFKSNILNAIISIPHKDERFDKFYRERKWLVEKLTQSDIATFVAENRVNLEESVYKLTDQTLVERQEFVALFANINSQILLSRINEAYPALGDYLWNYTFNDSKATDKLNSLFTKYFDRYKWQKIFNQIDDDFLTWVEELAGERVFTHLRSRNEVIGSIDSAGTFLYWVDALGVEFLGFIQRQCKQKGIRLRVHIAQAELPTITSINKGDSRKQY